MAFEVRPVLDLKTCRLMTSTVYSAFADSPFAVIIYPNGQSESQMEAQAQEHFKETTSDPSIKHLMVIDTAKEDEPIAFATYFLSFGEKHKPVATDQKRVEPVPGSNAQAYSEISNELQQMREKWMGEKEHIYLRELVTSPAHQRRGAGSLLIRWGQELAKKHDLPLYLCSVEEAYRTYEKNGFKALDTMRFNLTKYGGNGVTEEKFFAWTAGEDASAHDH